jgi:hypothetical protein
MLHSRLCVSNLPWLRVVAEAGITGGATRLILRLAHGADIALPRAHDVIEPRIRHAPVGVLVGAHVVVEVPGQLAAGPLRVEVGTLVLAVVTMILDGMRRPGGF